MLSRAQTLKNNAVVVQMAPRCSHRAATGQGLGNLPFSLEKTLQAAATCFRRHGVEGCLSPWLHPFLPGTVAPHNPSISFCERRSSGLVGRGKPEGAQLAACLALQRGLFLAFHLLPACTSIPNALQPLAQQPVVLPSMS